MLAERMKNLAPSSTLAVQAKAKALRAQGVDVISFGAGEPDFDTPERIKAAAVEAMRRGQTKYTEVAGIPELRQAVCAKLKRDNGLEYEPGDILVSCGAKHALFNMAVAVLNPGDEVLIPSPYWVSYPEQARLVGGVPVEVETREATGFDLDPDRLRAAVGPRTKVIILNSPNNPTGAVFSREALTAVARLAVEKRLLVVSDECYEALTFDGRHVSIASLGPEIKARTLVVNTCSKAYAMTGWRIGYAAGPRELIRAMTDVQSQMTSNASSVAQWAAVEALAGSQNDVGKMAAEFDRRRHLIVDGLNALDGVSCVMPKGAFYAFANVSALFGRRWKSAETTVRLAGSVDVAAFLLEQARVAVVPGLDFGSDAHVRLSYATTDTLIRKGSRAWTPRSASCCRLGPLGGEPDEARRLVRRARAAPEGLGRVPRPQGASQGDPRLREARGARERRVQGDAEDRRGGGEGNLRGQGASVGQEAARVVPPRGRGQWRPGLRQGRHGDHVHRDRRRHARLLQRRRTGGWADRRRWPADDRRRVEDDGRSVLQPHERIAAVRLTPRPMAARYLEPRLERSSRAEMTRLQTRRFKEQLRHAYAHSPFYCRKLKAAGVTPAAIRTLDDLRKLPFTTKDELKENQAVKPPWGDVLAVPFADVLRVHMTLATTGRPLAFLDTREDWHGFYHSYARSLYAYGVRRPDVVMAAFSYGPWIGYWSGFYAAQGLGCLVFPVGGLTTDQPIGLLLSYPITVLGCTPSYALFLAEAAGKGDRPRQASEGPHHVAHGRAGRLDPRDEGEDRGGVRREGVRPPRAHRDRRVGVRVRRAGRPDARARGLLLSRDPRRAGPARRPGRARRAGLHEPLPEGDAAHPVPHT